MDPAVPLSGATKRVALTDRWTVDRGRIVISGTQALARLMLDRKALDRRAGINSAGYITGYRGSPLGNVDSALWGIADRLKAAEIRFQPAVNEDIAATAVRGTQQIEAFPDPLYDGVFAAWYGKGPGIDRSGDALKHGNYAGAHAKGGVLVIYGDDHAAKSSTVAHHSEQAVAAAKIPSLYPSNVEEIRRFGLLGYAMSRYSGSWVGLKCITEIVEQTASIDIDLDAFDPVLPPLSDSRRGLIGLHSVQGAFNPLNEERIVVEERLPLVQAFVRANRIDREVWRADQPRIGIVTAGKAYGDVLAALDLIGLDQQACADLGVSLFKVGCIWPLDPVGLGEFADGHRLLFVVEEKSAFLEPQIAAALINHAERIALVGKRDLAGEALLSSVQPLEAKDVATALRQVLAAEGVLLPPAALAEAGPGAAIADLKRLPYFCSGCPHNRSTRLPEGSLSLTGIGCHTMVNFVRPQEALLPTQMGGEGGNWIGASAFSGTPHVFQNLGDGTYFHSGLLAIRAAVASGVNITYKILYNDAVAMTGGQPIDGPISVGRMAQQVAAEGVTRIVVLSDAPDRYRGDSEIPADTEVGHRDTLDEVQKSLRDTPGCTILIYEQTCAAEKRRRRKRGELDDPPRRIFIAKSVCEGCGDCSEMSTCVSLLPVETAFGTKREIDQSSCNKDYSCADGFCPSFITVHGAEPRRPGRAGLDDSLFRELPAPARAAISGTSFNIMIAGIGGTGVITVGAVIGMAAHIEGLAMSAFDMTGVSQKNGAVFSHLKIGHAPESLATARIAWGTADILLAFDMVAGLAAESATSLSPARTKAVVNSDVVPTAAFQFDRDMQMQPRRLLDRLRGRIIDSGVQDVNAKMLAERLLGDSIGANMMIVGIAIQSGLLPVSVAAVEGAIRLNGVAVPFNLDALRLGRLFAVDPQTVLRLAEPAKPAELVPASLDEVIAHRAGHLIAYQGVALRNRYLALVARVRAVWGEGPATMAVARNYARLLAYKDEYEVARLLTQPAMREELAQNFEAGGRIELNLAPPMLPGRGRLGRPRKRAFSARFLSLLGLLARCRGLRGTAFDPFGRTRDRRIERALIGEYEALVDAVLAGRNDANRGAGAELLALADMVRGYGPVKEKAVDRYRDAVARALADYLAKAAPVPADPAATEALPVAADASEGEAVR